MRRIGTALALLAIGSVLLAGAAALADQVSPSITPHDTSLPVVEPPSPAPSPDGPLVVQYGDPDDAITGNRGPSFLGQTSGGNGTGQSQVSGDTVWVIIGGLCAELLLPVTGW